MDFRSYLEWRELIYSALRSGVDEGFTKLHDFADEIGKSTSEASLRLRRADDGKGYAQTAPVDFLATLAMRPGSLERFLTLVAKAKGQSLVPDHPPSDAETAKALAAEMTDKQRRRLEREKGWPEGWLDR